MEALEKAGQLKNELDNLRPLNAEAEARIMQKFRLDWNYHSNNLEGNSLTYGETKALILFGITAQGKPLKDHFEITGHNEAINWILEIVKGETVLTEAFIRQLHTLLLKESSYKEALTAEGKPTRRKIEVGKYKSQPNHVITITGETFYFATPEETPAKMHDLIEWFRKEKDKPEVNPIILAALFHYRFIRIHPFDDGNGRVARILMNFILMQFGYPPVIIKTEDKENYYAVLRLADADELEPFIEYIAQNLVRSLEIMIKGAKGENIEEPNDLDKELALLERRIKSISPKKGVKKSKKSLSMLVDNSINPLYIEFNKACDKFARFYLKTEFYIYIDETGYRIIKDYLGLENKEIAKSRRILIFCQYTKFKEEGFGNFDFESRFSLRLETKNYSIRNANDEIVYEKKYSEQLSCEETNKIVSLEIERHKKFIEEKIDLPKRKSTKLK
jgi:Fic family protein